MRSYECRSTDGAVEYRYQQGERGGPVQLLYRDAGADTWRLHSYCRGATFLLVEKLFSLLAAGADPAYSGHSKREKH